MEPFCIPASLGEAGGIQKDIRIRVESESHDIVGTPSLVAGTDVTYTASTAYAAVVMMNYPGLVFCSRIEVQSKIQFPYIPGYFAFREIPALLEAFSMLVPLPDLILVHGHGYAHPRRVGVATHLGYFLKIPSIGVAGRRMSGMDAPEPEGSPGSTSPVIMGGERVGTMLRTREGSAPVLVSAGYRTTLSQAEEITLKCCRGSRFPEPVLLADRASREMRRRCEG